MFGRAVGRHEPQPISDSLCLVGPAPKQELTESLQHLRLEFLVAKVLSSFVLGLIFAAEKLLAEFLEGGFSLGRRMPGMLSIDLLRSRESGDEAKQCSHGDFHGEWCTPC